MGFLHHEGSAGEPERHRAVHERAGLIVSLDASIFVPTEEGIDQLEGANLRLRGVLRPQLWW